MGLTLPFCSTMDAFKKANLKSMISIEKVTKEELLKPSDKETEVRLRQKRDKEVSSQTNLVPSHKMSLE